MKIALVRSTAGCVYCQPIQVDPYWREVEAGERWHDVARGDGHSYGGVVEELESTPNETPAAFEARAWRRVDQLRAEGWGCRC